MVIISITDIFQGQYEWTKNYGNKNIWQKTKGQNDETILACQKMTGIKMAGQKTMWQKWRGRNLGNINDWIKTTVQKRWDKNQMVKMAGQNFLDKNQRANDKNIIDGT